VLELRGFYLLKWKGAKIILHVKLPTSRRAKLKGFYNNRLFWALTVFSWNRSAIYNRWFLGPTRVHNANSISIALAIFAELNRSTDHDTQSVTIGGIYYVCSIFWELFGGAHQLVWLWRARVCVCRLQRRGVWMFTRAVHVNRTHRVAGVTMVVTPASGLVSTAENTAHGPWHLPPTCPRCAPQIGGTSRLVHVSDIPGFLTVLDWLVGGTGGVRVPEFSVE